MESGSGFGTGALVVIGLYLVMMIGVGWVGRLRRQSDSMADFYLAGRSMGLAVLLLTLYATQYSGNTMFGYTGKAYRIGFEWTVSILFMFSIIVGYLLFAPRLVALSRRLDFITPRRLHPAPLRLARPDPAGHPAHDLRPRQLHPGAAQGDGGGGGGDHLTAASPRPGASSPWP